MTDEQSEIMGQVRAIGECIGLLESCIKWKESWSPTCETISVRAGLAVDGLAEAALASSGVAALPPLLKENRRLRTAIADALAMLRTSCGDEQIAGGDDQVANVLCAALSKATDGGEA